MRDGIAAARAGAQFEEWLRDEDLQEFFTLCVGAPLVARIAAGLLERLLFGARLLLGREHGGGRGCVLRTRDRAADGD